MRTAKHTPGPWLLDGTYVYQDDATGRTIADCAHNKNRDRAEQVANAKLIAAAPELLDALRDALKALAVANIAGQSLYAAPVTEKIRAVIAKAE